MTLALGAVVIGATVWPASGAHAGVVPPIPSPPPPPSQLAPVLQVVAPAGNASIGVICATAGPTGLVLILLPGLPATAAKLGLPPIAVPGFDLPSELKTAAGDIVSLQDATCAYIPAEAEHTVCAPDTQLTTAATLPPAVSDLLNTASSGIFTPGLVPRLPPTMGTVIDTLDQLSEKGIPGLAPLATSMTNAFDCKVQSTSPSSPSIPGGGPTSGPGAGSSSPPVVSGPTNPPGTIGVSQAQASGGFSYPPAESAALPPPAGATPTGSATPAGDVSPHVGSLAAANGLPQGTPSALLGFLVLLTLLLYRSLAPRDGSARVTSRRSTSSSPTAPPVRPN